MEALTLGINLTISFLEDDNAGNFVPSAAAHNATVKPFFVCGIMPSVWFFLHRHCGS